MDCSMISLSLFRYRERGEFFSNRMVRHYNDLPNTVKQSATVNAFKNSLDEHRQKAQRSTKAQQEMTTGA